MLNKLMQAAIITFLLSLVIGSKSLELAHTDSTQQSDPAKFLAAAIGDGWFKDQPPANK